MERETILFPFGTVRPMVRTARGRLATCAVTILLALLLSWSSTWGASEERGRALLAEGDKIRKNASTSADFEQALTKYREALSIFETAGSESGKAAALANEGLIHSIRGRYKDALDSYSQAIKAARQSGDLKAQITALKRLGELDRATGRYREALKLYGEALVLARRSHDPDQQAEILNGEGVVRNATGNGEEALRLFGQALEIKKRMGDLRGQGTILNNMASVYRATARYDEALQTYREALTLRRKAGDLLGEGVTLDNLALTHVALGHYAKALEYGEKSLDIRHRLGDVKGESITLANIALVFYDTGRYRTAADFYNRALLTAKSLGDSQSEGTILNNLGAISKRLGQYEKALDLYAKALALAKQIGNTRGEGVTLDNMAQVYDSYGRYRKALGLHTEALALRRKTGDMRGEAVTLSNIALVYRNSGRLSEALGYYEKTLETFRKIGDAKSEATTVLNVGKVCEDQGRYHEALEHYVKGLRLCQRLKIPTSRANDLIGNAYLELGSIDEAEEYIKKGRRLASLGLLSLIKGDLQQAERYYGKLAALMEKSGNAEELFAAYTGLGKVHESRGDYDAAEVYYEKGLRITEEMRSSLLPSQRKTFFAVKTRGFYRSEPAKGLTRVRMKLNKPVESIDSSEAARARGFADTISTRSEIGYSGVPPEILDREEELVTRLAYLKSNRAAKRRDKDPERFDGLSEQIAVTEKEQKAFIDELWLKYKPYAAVKYPRPVSLKEAEVGPDEYCLLFDVLGEAVGVKLLRGKSVVKSLYLPYPVRDLERDVALFRRPFETAEFRGFDPDLARRLYEKLLAPILLDVPKGTKLVIMPDGVLSLLPFEALVTGGTVKWTQRAWGDCPEGLDYLGDAYPISYQQSLTALTLMRTFRKKPEQRNRLLVLADPVFLADEERAGSAEPTPVTEWDRKFYPLLMAAMQGTGIGGLSFERLEETGELARSLGRLYGNEGTIWTGLSANKRDFLNVIAPHLDRYAWIVFATHGVLSMRIPGLTEPFLALTLVPVGTDGYLRMSEVMGLRMNADMVALTACQTGLGKEIEGEGIMSMGRAFQYAGARSVLISLWSVAEKSSVIQAESIFRSLRQDSSKLEALRHSRQEVRRAGYDHPFFWASFVLVGEVD